MNFNVVRDTELRHLLYDGSSRPELHLEIDRVEFNMRAERPVAQVTGHVVSHDDGAPFLAAFQFDPEPFTADPSQFHLAQLLYGHGRNIPDALAIAVKEAITREADRLFFERGTDAAYTSFTVRRRVRLFWCSTAYACDHLTWETPR